MYIRVWSELMNHLLYSELFYRIHYPIWVAQNRSFNFGFAPKPKSTSSWICLTIDLGFERVLPWPCVSKRDHRATPGTQRLGSKPIAWRLEARDCTRWPRPAQPQPSTASTRHSQLCSAPSSLWPPCTFTSCAFLAPAARCIWVYAARPFRTLSFPSISRFFLFWFSLVLLFSESWFVLLLCLLHPVFSSSASHPSVSCQTQGL